MSTASSDTSNRAALRLPHAIAGWSIALLLIVEQVYLANMALRSNAASTALQFLLMLPLTVFWCFIMSLFLPAAMRRALSPFASKVPGIGTAICLYTLFAIFVMNYGFK
jgi:hypothetical protein